MARGLIAESMRLAPRCSLPRAFSRFFPTCRMLCLRGILGASFGGAFGALDCRTIVVQVIDGDTGAPVQGAKIALLEPGHGAPCDSVLERMESDAEGRFTLMVLDPSTLEKSALYLEVRADGYGPAWKRLASSIENLHARDIQIELDRPAWLSLSARSSSGEALRGGFLDILVHATPWEDVGPRWVGLSRPSAYEEEEQERIEDAEQQEEEQESDEEESFVESGAVEDQDLEYPLPTVYGLPSDTKIAIELGYGGTCFFQTTATLRSGPNPIDAEINFPVTLRGTLLDQDGLPVPGWPVGFVAPLVTESLRPNCYPFVAVRTATDGAFALPVFPGRWWVGAGCFCALDDDMPESRTEWLASFGQWVEVPEGIDGMNLDLRADRGLGISGQVLSAEGDPVIGAEVFVTNDRSLHGIEFETGGGHQDADGDGRFDLRAIPFGPHRVRARVRRQALPSDESLLDHEGCWGTASKILMAGSTDVVLQLTQGCTVQGTVVDAKTLGPVIADVEFHGPDLARARSLSNGKFRLAGMAAGVYRVLAVSRGKELALWSEGIELREGSSPEMQLSLRPAAHLRVKNQTLDDVICEVEIAGEVVRRYSLEPASDREWTLPPTPVTLQYSSELGYYRLIRVDELSLEPGETRVVVWWGER